MVDTRDGAPDASVPRVPGLFAGVYAPSVAADPALGAIEAASGRALSVVQTYHSLSAQGIANTGPDLAAIFARGQVAHLNVEPAGYTAAQYAAPGQDPLAADLAAMASTIGDALETAPAGRMLLTFGAEMNGSWTDWGCMPAARFITLYRAAHGAVDAALDARAIDRRRVRWVYGPNSRSSASCGSIVGYYPGHAYVDLLGLSAYRSGTETVGSAVFGPIDAMFSGLGYPASWQRDRFVMLQTGSREVGDRAPWIASLFQTAAADARVAGIIYFDAADWAAPASELAPAIAAAPAASPELDALFTPYFWDVPYEHPEFVELQALRDEDITSGCAAAPPRFCPDEPIKAADANVLLARTFPGLTAALVDPVGEQDLAAALAAAGHPPPPTTSIRATRARAAAIIARAADLHARAL